MVTNTSERVPRECGDEGVGAGRGPGQRGWYQWISSHVAGLSVLDVGCGLGYGLDILRTTAREVHGQDVDPRLAAPDILIQPLESFASSSFDVVTSVDVIEHIREDYGFVEQLARIGRRRIIMTTPNWTASRCHWPFHVREYTPAELRHLGERFGTCTLWKGTPDGAESYPIRHPALNDALNRIRVTPGVSQLGRAINLCLPSRARIHSHLAIVIDVMR